MSFTRNVEISKFTGYSVFLFPFSFFIGNAAISLLWALILLLALPSWKRERFVNNMHWKKPFFWGLLFFIWMVTSILWTSNREAFFLELNSKLTFLFSALILAGANIGRPGIWKNLAWGFAIAGFGMGVACVAFAVYEIPIATNVYDLFAYQTFARPARMQAIYFAMLCVVGVFASLSLWTGAKRKYGVLMLLLGNSIWVIMLSSRMEIMVLFSLGFGLAVRYAILKKKIFQVLGFMFLVATILGSFIWFNPTNKLRFQEMLQYDADINSTKFGGSSLRLMKWENTLELIGEKPFFGTGGGDLMDDLLEVYERNNFTVAIREKYNPHNQYLQTLATYGVFGLLCLVMYFFTLIRAGVKRKLPFLSWLTVILLLSMITESALERYTGSILTGFVPLLLLSLLPAQRDGV